MTGEKRTETRMRCYNTVYSLYITPRPSYTMHAGRGGVIYREYTECCSISFLFLFFFRQSSLYPIKIFAKCFYLLVKRGVVVGHLPQKFCRFCSLFLNRGDTIGCTVTGARRHSTDLPQGGLEVPCSLLLKAK